MFVVPAIVANSPAKTEFPCLLVKTVVASALPQYGSQVVIPVAAFGAAVDAVAFSVGRTLVPCGGGGSSAEACAEGPCLRVVA